MIPRDSYTNSDIKNMLFMNVRNFEGWNPSEHPVWYNNLPLNIQYPGGLGSYWGLKKIRK